MFVYHAKDFVTKKNVAEINKFKAQINISIWKDLMAYIRKRNINSQYICDYCELQIP